MNFMLVGDAGCRWEFVYCIDSWRATPTEAKWSDEFGVVLQSIGPSESLLKNSLRFSNSLTFQHLVKIATDLKLHAPKRLSRKELLRELAKVLSPDDPGFVELVLQQDTKSKKGAVSSGNLAKKQKRLAKAKAKPKASTKGKGKGRAKSKGGSKGRGVKRRLDLDNAVESECEENHGAEAEDSTVPVDAPQHVAEGEASTVPADADAPVLAEVEEQVAVAVEEQVAVAEEQVANVDEPTLPMESEHKDELIQEKSEIEIEESGAAQSSSGVGDEVVPPVVPPGDSGAEAAVRVVGPRVFTTADILERIEPYGIFKVRLDFNAHRFQLETKVKENDPRWVGQKAQKTLSKSFQLKRTSASSRGWESALVEIHKHIWEKFNLAKDRWGLRENMEEQRPGEVPADVITDLKPIIARMPPATQYAKK
eukprot:symbB.v1.2.022202.t1/scaffold1958.1/size138524/13